MRFTVFLCVVITIQALGTGPLPMSQLLLSIVGGMLVLMDLYELQSERQREEKQK